MSNFVTIEAYVDRMLAIAAGRAQYGRQTLRVNLDDLSPEDRATLARFPAGKEADVDLATPHRRPAAMTGWRPALTSELTQEYLCEQLAAARAWMAEREKEESEAEAEAHRKREAEIAAAVVAGPESAIHTHTVCAYGYTYRCPDGLHHPARSITEDDGPEAVAYRLACEAELKRRISDMEAMKAETAEWLEGLPDAVREQDMIPGAAIPLPAAEREKRSREAREALAEAAQEEAERRHWIQEHGSARLWRLLTEGIEHGAVYRSERLAAERPGWRYTTDPEIPEYETHEPRNATEEALALLDKARETAPDAELEYAVLEIEDDYGETTTWRGYTLTAQFLGRDIVYLPEGFPLGD